MTGDEPVKFLVMDAIANEKCRVPKVDSIARIQAINSEVMSEAKGGSRHNDVPRRHIRTVGRCCWVPE